MSKQTESYAELDEELREVMQKIESQDSNKLEETLQLYARAEELIAKMRERLENAENTITKIQNVDK